MPINAYTKQLIIPREFGRLDNPSAIDAAGSAAFGFSKVAGVAAEYAQREQEAKEKVALNEAMIKFQKGAIDLDDQLKQANMATPDGYSDRAIEERKKLRKSIEDSLPSGRAKQLFSMSAAEMDNRFYANDKSWEKTRNVEIMGESINTSINDLQVMAARGDVELDGLINNLKATVISGQDIFAPEVISEMERKSGNAIVATRLDTLIQNGNLKEAKSLLDSKKYDDFLGGDGINKGYKAIDAEQKRREAEWRATQVNSLKSEYKTYVEAMDLGLRMPPEFVATLIDRAEATGNSEVADEIRLMDSTANNVELFVKDMNLQQQQETLASLAGQIAESPTKENIFAYKQIAKSFEAKEKAIMAGDGLQYYAKIGLVDVPNIDISNPESVIAGMQQRQIAQQQIFDREGIVVPMLTKAEASGMADYYNSLGLEDKQNYIMQITSNMADNDAKMLASVVAKYQPALAAAVASSKENPRLLNDIIQGGAYKNKVLSKKDVYAQVVAKIGDAVQDPVALNAIADGVMAAAENRHQKDGATIIDTSLIDDVLEEMVGEKITFGNSSIMPFKNKNGEFVDTGEFKDMIDLLTPEMIEKVHGSVPYIGNRPITIEELQDAFFDFQVDSIGDGLYRVRNDTDVLVDKSGKPFVFDFKAMYANPENYRFSPSGELFKGVSGILTRATQPLPSGDK